MTPVHVEVEKNIKNVAENQFKKVKEDMARLEADESFHHRHPEEWSKKYGDLQHRLEDLGDYDRESRAKTILQGLGFLRDKQSAKAFRSAAKEKDLEIRLAGLWSLTRIPSAEDAQLLLDTANKEKGWGRIKATGYCLQLAEALAAAGKKKDAAKIYQNLKKNRNAKNESHVRLACDKGLANLK